MRGINCIASQRTFPRRKLVANISGNETVSPRTNNRCHLTACILRVLTTLVTKVEWDWRSQQPPTSLLVGYGGTEEMSVRRVEAVEEWDTEGMWRTDLGAEGMHVCCCYEERVYERCADR
jgi:hypothetical protein